jgi:hypothetical protein
MQLGDMNAQIADKKDEVARLCQKHRVRRLELFGSAARATRGAQPGDVDFLVRFEPMTPAQHADCFFGLQADLEQLFGLPVDLVEPEPIRNPYFRQAVEQSKVLVYAAA